MHSTAGRRALIVLVVGGLLLATTTAANAREGDTPGEIRVWDGERPIAGASVEVLLFVTDGPPRLETMATGLTNAQGIFSYESHAGPYQVVVRAAGYAEGKVSFELPMNAPGNTQPVVTIVRLKRAGSTPLVLTEVAVFVQDEAGRALNANTVVAISGERTFQHRARGQRLEYYFGLPPGRYDIVAQMPGFHQGRAQLLVQSGSQPGPVTIRMRRSVGQTLPVVFQVTDQAGGTPIAGATISVYRQSDDEEPRLEGRSQTDRRGQFRVDMPLGAYRATVTMGGYLPAEGAFEVSPETAGPNRPNVLRIELTRRNAQRPGRLIVLAVDENEKPLMADIGVQDAAGRPIEPMGQPGRSGALVFEVPPGRYVVLVRRPGYETIREAVGVDGGQEKPLTFRLTRVAPQEAGVIIRVVDGRQRPLGDARVTIFVDLETGRRRVAREQTDASGRARFSLEPGPYAVVVKKDDYGRIESNFEAVVMRPAGALLVHKVVLERAVQPARLSIRVLDENGQPIMATVVVRDSFGKTHAPVGTLGDGTIRYDVPQGEYEIAANRDGYEPARELIGVPAGQARPITLRLTRIVRDASVTIDVRDAGGGVVGGARVEIVKLGAKSEVVASGLSNRGGQFQKSLPAGRYQVSVEKNGYETTDSSFEIPRTASPPPIRHRVTLPKIATRTVTISVLDEKGKPTRASLTLVNRKSEEIPASDTTPPNHYHFDLLPGRYRAIATKDGYHDGHLNVDVELSSKPLDLKVRLRAEPIPEPIPEPEPVVPTELSITVLVLDQDEKPIEGASVSATRPGGKEPAVGTTDARGQCRLVVAAGGYRITAEMKGYTSDDTEAEVESGNISFELVLVVNPDAEPDPPEDPTFDETYDVLFQRLDKDKDDDLDAKDFSAQGWDAFKLIFARTSDAPLPRAKFADAVRAVLPKEAPKEADVPQGPPPTPADTFARLDRNRDGRLGPDDFSGQGWADFKRLFGLSSDSSLSLAEFTKVAQAASEEFAPEADAEDVPPPRDEAAQDMHARMDTNGDGIVDKKDFNDQTWRALQGLKVDKNGDGILSVEELSALIE